MGIVVFAGVDAPLVSSLRKNAMLAQARFEEVGDPELALERLGDGEIDAMVIGTDVAEAMVLAQRAHAKDRDVAVLLLAAQGASAQIRGGIALRSVPRSRRFPGVSALLTRRSSARCRSPCSELDNAAAIAQRSCPGGESWGKRRYAR